jgi:hypothetical protein
MIHSKCLPFVSLLCSDENEEKGYAEASILLAK